MCTKKKPQHAIVLTGMFWYSMGGWIHPLVFPLTLRLTRELNILPASFPGFAATLFRSAAYTPRFFRRCSAEIAQPIAAAAALEQANIITYRTRDGSLSSAQDHVLKGLFGK
jgi:hypothetical protein